jgi:hypothetical protein
MSIATLFVRTRFMLQAKGLVRIVAAVITLALPCAASAPPVLVTEKWTGWMDLAGSGSIGTSCVSSQPGHLDCFAEQLLTPSEFGIGRKQLIGTTVLDWVPLHGIAPDSSFKSRPECLSWGPDHIDCFIRRDSDKAFFRRTMDGNFTGGWEALGGTITTTSDPSCVSTAPQRLDCFARGADGQLMQISFDGNLWGPWTPRGGQILQDTKPSCVILGPAIECGAVRTDGTMQMFRVLPTGHVAIINSKIGLQLNVVSSNSPRCVAAPGVGATGPRVECFAPTSTTNPPTEPPVLGRWTFTGGIFKISNLGAIQGPGAVGIGPDTYDWDCVFRGGDRIDCVDIFVPQVVSNTTPPTFRHIRLSSAVPPNPKWDTVSLTPVANSQFPISIRCASQDAEHMDCFAAGGGTVSTRLWRASLVAPTFRPQH